DRVLRQLRSDPQPATAAVGRALSAAVAMPSAAETSWIERIEGLRAQLGGSTRRVRARRSEWTGAQDDEGRVREAPVARLALELSKPERWGRVLLHLTRELRPTRTLELGTCIGLSTAYQAAGLELAGIPGVVVTLEADPGRVELARANLAHLGLDARVEARVGRFEDQLDEVLDEAGGLGFAFVDGHHRLEPTLDYFERIVRRLSRPGVVLLDDIRWSEEMAEAWSRVAADPRVALALDLHGLGLCLVADQVGGAGDGPRTRSLLLHP
ncbi:MAG TPA: class I SAM-dependent methyltransferase, partial [Thermoleophilaceae bacterium]|nr:class I SAM-dependent methyltransferase [Thermoleophilaceae bacterium]